MCDGRVNWEGAYPMCDGVVDSASVWYGMVVVWEGAYVSPLRQSQPAWLVWCKEIGRHQTPNTRY